MEDEYVNWDYISNIGHNFTLVDGPIIGRYIYYCENCATLMMTAGGLGKVAIWHSPHGKNYMCIPRSNKDDTLKSKLEKLNKAQIASLMQEEDS